MVRSCAWAKPESLAAAIAFSRAFCARASSTVCTFSMPWLSAPMPCVRVLVPSLKLRLL